MQGARSKQPLPIDRLCNAAGRFFTARHASPYAIRHTPSGGDLKVCLISHGRELELQVRDDGPGIAPEDRERVFERFVRLPGQVERGSGLGLSIVQRIVKAEGSTLQFIEGLSGRGIGFAVCIRQPTEPPRVT